MSLKRLFSVDVCCALALFLLVGVIYLVTLCPTIYPGPSADAVCEVQGVSLTPAITSPVWLILGRFLSLFSPNTAYVLNLMSALFGALSIAFLYGILCQFTHTRTAEEDIRCQTHPYLPQLTAVSCALLVALSYPFWEGSLLAGPDTLNTFFLLLIVFLVARYARTSRARYALAFAFLYGLAITNYPTLFLLSPFFVVFFLLRGRALLDDPVAVVTMFILFGLGLLPALYEPRAYLLQAKDYVLGARAFGQASSVFFDSYLRNLKGLFPGHWLFWLFLPTFVPILFFMMKRADYERGSPLATTLTYLVRYAFVLACTVAGLAYLFGFIGPFGIREADFLRRPRYLAVYLVIGAWLSYVLGYWTIVLTAKFKSTATGPKAKSQYSKLGYAIAAIIILALPVLQFTTNYRKSSKRHCRYIEDFAKAILKSSPEQAIIIVPARPYLGSIGAPLRYFHSRARRFSSQPQTTIVDLNAAYLDSLDTPRARYPFHREKRMETARYLAETVLRRAVPEPRELFLPERPFQGVYDAILRCEMQRAQDLGITPRPICGLVNNFFSSSSPHMRGNNAMNRDYCVEPAGLLYFYPTKFEYRDTSAVIEKNEQFWNELIFSEKPPPQTGRSSLARYIFAEFSKSANDFGVFCQLAHRLDLAEKHYRKALELSPHNIAALFNLGLLIETQGNSDQAEALLAKYKTLIRERREQETDLLRQFGIVLDALGLIGTEKSLADRAGEDVRARRLAMLRLAARLMPDNPTIRERMGDILLSSSVPFSAEEARSEYIAALERTSPKDDPETSKMLRKLGAVYMSLGINSRAESFFKKALREDDPSTQVALINFYMTTNQKSEVVRAMAMDILTRVPKDEKEENALAPFKAKAAVTVATLLLNSGEVEQAKAFLNDYLSGKPERSDILLTLTEQMSSDPSHLETTIWLFEKYLELTKSLPHPQLPVFADALFRQKRYETIIALEEPTAGPDLILADFFRFKAMAYEKLGRNSQAEESYRRATSFVLHQRNTFAVRLLNNLAWRCFKNGNSQDAQKFARQAFDRDPANSLVWDAYGWILYKTTGQLQKPFDLIERSHLANPDFGIITYHYGKLLLEKGLDTRGIAAIQAALDVGIDSQEELDDARQILKRHDAQKSEALSGPA